MRPKTGTDPQWSILSELIKDLVRQMLRLHFDDETIIFHLKSANIRNARKILDRVLNEAKQEAIARLDLYGP